MPLQTCSELEHESVQAPPEQTEPALHTAPALLPAPTFVQSPAAPQ
jgi:hypothetical protein